jgi:NosR/NirI family nitrous oxide reductase transcriptional regulator
MVLILTIMQVPSLKTPHVCECPKSRMSKVSNNRKSRSKSKDKTNKIISWLAALSLLFAFIYGLFFNKIDFTEIIESQLKNDQVSMTTENEYQIVTNKDGKEKTDQLILGEESGYGGPMVVGPLVNVDGEIEKILLVDDKETHSFINKLIAHNFFKQFEGKHIGDPLFIDNDIDAVNGATISCVAITKAVNSSAHDFGEKYFGIQYEKVEETWAITDKDYAAIGIFLLAALALYSGKKWMRYLSLGVSMVFIGFYFNTAINVSQIGRVLLGFLPVFKSNVFWFVLVFGSIGFAFFLKKNIYCNAICPFHAVETIMIKIGGMKVNFTPQIQKIAKHSAKFLLWLALMIIFISRNPTLGSYEPFAMIFGLEGEGVQWYILPLVLMGVLLITDYFCRYFCPVGKGFAYIIKLRTWIDTQILSIKRVTLNKVKS